LYGIGGREEYTFVIASFRLGFGVFAFCDPNIRFMVCLGARVFGSWLSTTQPHFNPANLSLYLSSKVVEEVIKLEVPT
jgi:hypothetical protein